MSTCNGQTNIFTSRMFEHLYVCTDIENFQKEVDMSHVYAVVKVQRDHHGKDK